MLYQNYNVELRGKQGLQTKKQNKKTAVPKAFPLICEDWSSTNTIKGNIPLKFLGLAWKDCTVDELANRVGNEQTF